jgi:acyl-CoA synthetase (AMP-forming)/AMP-acid ligase II/uncharacterized membrane protein YcfT
MVNSAPVFVNFRWTQTRSCLLSHNIAGAKMFDGIQSKLTDHIGSAGDKIAAIDAARSITYDELAARADALCARIGPDRQLILLEGGNHIDWLVGYVAGLRGGHPLLITPAGAHATLDHFEDLFSASIRITAATGWLPAKTGRPAPDMHPDLALMLSTSGSTGSTKCVRLSAQNLVANAAAIADYLKLDASERGTVNLPTHYSYGLSIVNSHLFAGATMLLTEGSVIDKEFWAFLREHGATSFAGVPHVYDLLRHGDLATVAPPTLRYFTQAGGRLPAPLAAHFAGLAAQHGWRFYIMYGQTEATARIAYMPPELAESCPGSIGLPIPGGRIAIVDDTGAEVPAGSEGEFVYHGPNVMMGYATGPDDLASEAGPPSLPTGDIGRLNPNGLFEITGRKSRFIKIFGNRIGLDDVEKLIAEQQLSAIATGIDDQLLVVTRAPEAVDAIAHILAKTLKIPAAYSTIRVVDDYPLLATGKIDYASLKSTIAPPTSPTIATEGDLQAAVGPESVEDAFVSVFGEPARNRSASFNSLGGDSLNYVLVVVALEHCLPDMPNNWEALSIEELTALAEGQDMAPTGSTSTRSLLRKLATLDVARGMCMLLVVMMHVDEVHYSQIAGHNFIVTLWDLVTSVAKPMRMPTFFLISGVLVGQAVWRPWREIARGRIIFLLYIYLLWSTLGAINTTIAHMPSTGIDLDQIVFGWAKRLIFPQSELWFIYGLLLYFLAARAMRNWPLWLSLGIAALLSAFAEKLGGPPLTYLARSLLFYLIGVYLPRIIDEVLARATWPATFAIGAIYLVAAGALAFVNQSTVGIWLPASFAGVGLGLMISSKLAQTALGKPFIYIGQHTLPIYVLHSILVRDWHLWLNAVHADSLAILISHPIVRALYPLVIDVGVVLCALGIYRVLLALRLDWLFELPVLRWGTRTRSAAERPLANAPSL